MIILRTDVHYQGLTLIGAPPLAAWASPVIQNPECFFRKRFLLYLVFRTKLDFLEIYSRVLHQKMK